MNMVVLSAVATGVANADSSVLDFWPAWVALVLAVVIQPVCVLLAHFLEARNKREERHIETLKFEYEHKVEVYRKFARTYAPLKGNNSLEAEWDFAGAAYEAALACGSNEIANQIIFLAHCVSDNDMTEADCDSQFKKCILLLSTSMNETHAI